MEEERCIICGEKPLQMLLHRYNNKNVYLCSFHTMGYTYMHSMEHPERARLGIPISRETHCKLIEAMFSEHMFNQIQTMKQNAEYMHNIMSSWGEGCLSNTEVIIKMAVLSDETRKIALELKGGE